MAENGHARTGQRHPEGYWGKWRGVTCSEAGCDRQAICQGFCSTHYNKWRWANGYRAASINPQARREARLRNRYGIGQAEFDALLAQQGGVCAVCKQPPDSANTRAHWGGKLCIDHCHETNTIRGLLCNDCNLMVGYGRTEDRLLAAAQYLRNRSR